MMLLNHWGGGIKRMFSLADEKECGEAKKKSREEGAMRCRCEWIMGFRISPPTLVAAGSGGVGAEIGKS